MELYRDPSASLDQRLNDLLERMTIDEKIAQLGSSYADALLESGHFSSRLAGQIMPDGIGQISAIGRTSGLESKELFALANTIQRFLLTATRLGIPAIVHEECLNGLRARGAAIFPQNLGLAAAWDSELVNRITSVIRRQARSVGIHQGLAPVLDVSRDPRWGRTEETFGEDPFLVAEMGMAYIRGLQGDSPASGVAATVKHFAGHGLSEGGLNCAPAQIPPRLLRDVYLYPFRKAVCEAAVLSLMNAYHELDGLPCGASVELLTEILRNKWGFKGVVVSDYYAIGQLMTIHHICDDIGTAAGLAISAGIDLELPKSNGFALPLKEQVSAGRVSMDLINRAVERVLRLKFSLGLFEQPLVAENIPIDLDSPDDRSLALEAARRSMVLLKNEKHRLPLTKNLRTIAVIGPNADNPRNMLGDYTFPSGAGYELESSPLNGQVEVVWKDRELQSGRVDSPRIVTVLDGIRQCVSPSTQVLYARGCGVTENDTAGFEEARRAAAQADAAVVVVGGCSGLLPQCTSGEMRDSLSLALPGVQEELVKTILDTGTPVILVIISGRPHVLGALVDRLEAVIEAWLPGEEGGRAVAEVIFGEYSPGGKLPLSIPAHCGQVPVYYGHKPSGGRSSPWGDYVEGSVKPRFEFGYGLSYTTFAFSDLVIHPQKLINQTEINVSLNVVNSGDLAGDEVVQLYIRDVTASLTRPLKQLKGFKRVNLQPGETRRVTFRLPYSELAFSGLDMQPVVEPGLFKVMVGNSSENIFLEGEFELIK